MSTICQLLHTLHVGGAELIAARLGRKLSNEYRFVFVCLDEAGSVGEELRGQGFVVEVLGRRAGIDWRCAMRLARTLEREQVDLVHAHQYTPFFYGTIARWFHRRAPVLFTEHGRHFPDYPRIKRKFANRLLLERRDRAVGVGQAVRKALIQNEGLPASRVGVIYNGIDAGNSPSHGNGLLPGREAARRALRLASEDFVILHVARLDYLKDHATAIRMMSQVVARRPNAKLLLAGEGPDRAAIEHLVESQKLGASIRLLGLRDDVGKLLMASDLFLLTSISEGIPLTILEAMAAGLPVVATRVGGVPEIVMEGETGLLAPAGNDAALACHVLRLAEDAELRERMGQSGQQRARAYFSETQMHGHYRDLYREMLRG